MSTMQPKCPSDDAVDVMAKEVRPPLQQQDGHQAKGTTKEKPRRNLSNEPGGDSGTRGVGGSGGGGGGGGGKLMHLVVDSAAIIKGAAMTLAAASEVISSEQTAEVRGFEICCMSG